MTRAARGIADVRLWGDLVPEGWYHVRIKKAVDTDKDGNQLLSAESSNPVCQIQMLIQDEPLVGSMIVDFPSMQPHALAKLKAYYEATGQGVFEDGTDDPEALADGECYVRAEHENYKGTTRVKIPPYGIKPLSEGRPQS